MRKRLYLSLIVVAMLCFMGWTGYARGQRGTSAVQMWEYHVDPVPVISGIQFGSTQQQADAAQAAVKQRLINQRAAEGWELAAVGQSFYYFKRPR
jgi:hypothetical protein